MPSKDKRKLAAIMFADVVGYSRMMASNEERTLELLKDFENICSPIISKHDGKIIKKVGDELFCEFSSAKQAVDSALEIQESIQPYNDSRPKDFKLQVRIGIHVGDIVLRDGDVFGDGVNVASRIQPFANPGGICVSNAVRDAISSHPSYNIKSEGQQELKNIIEKHTLYKVETGFEIAENINIKVPSNIFAQSKWKVWGFGIISTMLILGFYLSILGKSEDNLNRNFLIHYKGVPNWNNQNIIDSKIVNLIRNKMIPLLKTKFTYSDIKLFFPIGTDEFELLDKLPELTYEDYDLFNRYKVLKDSIPEYEDTYNLKFNVIDKSFEFFNNTLNENIDLIISVSLNENDDGLYVSSDIYSNNDGGRIDYNGGICNYLCRKVVFNLDSIEIIYNELAWHIQERVENERYGEIIGEVIEILDSTLLTIKLEKKNSIVKGMNLFGRRVFLHKLGAVTLDNIIDDRKILIEYYNNNPDKIEELRNSGEFPIDRDPTSTTHYELENMQFDDFIDDLKYEKDYIINNYEELLLEFAQSLDNVFWYSFNEYKVEVMKVHDDEAIVKIVDKLAPYVIPRKGDWIDLLDE